MDAANFHLVSGAVIRETHEFISGFAPKVNQDVCTGCGRCTDLCRFEAMIAGVITAPLNCEGCGVCAFNCPEHAIEMKETQAGHWFVSDTRFGKLIHAELGLSVENFRQKLVSKVRQEGKKIAEADGLPLIITDGPPGIGCPVIAALSGASLVLSVVEPSLSGIHDLERLTDLVVHFQLPVVVCINKSTLHPENTQRIITWCQDRNMPVVGQFPYSDTFRVAVQSGKTVLETADAAVKEPLTKMWHTIAAYLNVSVAEENSIN